MDVVLVGLPGSGKTAIGRRLASHHAAAFVDLDAEIERAAGTRIPEIFAAEGEAGFRLRERRVVEMLGPADPSPGVVRVIATGGGAVMDPRNRWRLYRGRRAFWLDGRPEVLAQRLRRSPNPRPLIAGRDPIGSIRDLAAARVRFYAPAPRIEGMAEPLAVVEAIERLLATPAAPAGPTTLLRAETAIGEVVLGEGIAAAAIDSALRRIGAGRVVIVSEPHAWAAAGARIASDLAGHGWTPGVVTLPSGETAKTLAVIERAARELAGLDVERGDALVAIGGGALTDPAGFLAATYLRGIAWIAVPTTLVAQIDAAIGGKTGVDLPEGKNLIGAFHQPAAVVIDLSVLETVPPRERRAAMGEAVKMAALGDERLFELLERDGGAIVAGDAAAIASGALAELVERAAWAKVAVVSADEREAAGRVALNLGHSLGHAFEAAGGYADLLHGEAVAYGLRAACRIGVTLGVTPEARAARIEGLLDALGLPAAPLPYPLEAVLEALGRDKKHRDGRLHWVLPTEAGHVVRDDVPGSLVASVAAGLLAGGAGVAAWAAPATEVPS